MAPVNDLSMRMFCKVRARAGQRENISWRMTKPVGELAYTTQGDVQIRYPPPFQGEPKADSARFMRWLV